MRGFTFPEILVATVLIVLVGALLLNIMVNSTGLFYKQSSKVEQNVGLNDALASIRSSIKEANIVALGYPESPPYTYTTNSSTLVLKVASIDSSGNIIIGSFDYFVYVLEDSKIKFKVFKNALSQRKEKDQILAQNAANLEFKYFDLNDLESVPAETVRIKVSVTLTQQAGVSVETKTAEAEARLRND